MDFAHYADDAAQLAENLVNSLEIVSGTEHLADPAALGTFLSDHDLKVPDGITDGDVDAVKRLRERLRTVFEAPDEGAAVGVLNELLCDVGARPEITNHDGEPWHLHYVASDAPVADHLTAISAMGIASVLLTFGWERLGVCRADECRDVFVDTSRNKSRRYCGESCSSRTNVARFRARHKQHAPNA